MNNATFNTTRYLPPLRRQRGFTLLEVLISMLVLSIGLLGLAGLQMTGLKNNNSSYQRSQANLLAYEMIDRIRANRTGLELGFYDDLFGVATNDPGCISSGCSVQQIAQYDAFLWSGEVANRLPTGTGTVTGTGANSIFTVTVMWDDDRTGATGTNCGGNPNVDLTCFVMSTTL
ncbi:type IV pilus modification protein PilV [Beggiatoa alba]|nr:type IV pilus modification protein PilV [Beggiatoa alba]